jgi:hypothetical protein
MAEPDRSRLTPPHLVSIPDAAPLVPCAPASLATPSFRRRLRIPYYQLGGRILFSPEEIAAWREQQRVTYETLVSA